MNKQIINRLMKIFKARSFKDLSRKIGISAERIGQVFHGKIKFSKNFFCHVAILLDAKPSELFEQLGISKEYFA